MATGYLCEFLDTVPEICLCKKCFLVARRITVTSCCGESFCYACISEPKEQNKPCPECGKDDFTIYNQVKHRRQINNLQVYCSLKERGCGWSGPLEQLEGHLDPEQDHCQYVDTKCPLKCQQTIPKNKMEQHVAEECVRRDFTCQHCNFKATYKEVVGKHLAECSYVPLQCPNRCGVTCERDMMEDHRRICHLEEVECEFSGVGCEERPKREDQEEHTRQSTQKHIALTVTATVRTKEIVLKKLNEQEQKVEFKVEEKLHEQNQHLQQKLEQQQQSFQCHVDMLTENIQIHQQELQKKDKKIKDLEQQLSLLTKNLNRWTRDVELRLPEFKSSFEIENFHEQKQWSVSPVMNIFLQGYRSVAVHLNFSKKFRNGERGMEVEIIAVSGQFDAHLKWPLNVEVTFDLLNTRGEKLCDGKWTGGLKKPGVLINFNTGIYCCEDAFVISKLLPNLFDNTLCFQIENIVPI